MTNLIDVEPEELLEAPDEPDTADPETNEVTAEADEPEGPAAASESDGGA